MPSVVTAYQPKTRTGSDTFADIDGVTSTAKHRDDVQTFTVDWADTLATSETISSVTNTASGLTLSGASNTSTTTTVIVTGIGSVEVKIVTSASRTLKRKFRFYERSGGANLTDY